jgi:ribonuclease HI
MYTAYSNTYIHIYTQLMHQKTFTLHNNCSNNQAEQWAFVKALATITELQTVEDIPREVTIHTDNRITLQSLKNSKNRKYLVEEIRKKAISLKKHNWKITFTWTHAHVATAKMNWLINWLRTLPRKTKLHITEFQNAK